MVGGGGIQEHRLSVVVLSAAAEVETAVFVVDTMLRASLEMEADPGSLQPPLVSPPAGDVRVGRQLSLDKFIDSADPGFIRRAVLCVASIYTSSTYCAVDHDKCLKSIRDYSVHMCHCCRRC